MVPYHYVASHNSVAFCINIQAAEGLVDASIL